MKKTSEKKTADEILDAELSESMLEYLNDNRIFREWIKDAMYRYATQCQQDNEERKYTLAELRSAYYYREQDETFTEFLTTLNKQ